MEPLINEALNKHTQWLGQTQRVSAFYPDQASTVFNVINSTATNLETAIGVFREVLVRIGEVRDSLNSPHPESV